VDRLLASRITRCTCMTVALLADLHIIRAKLEQDPPDYASLVEFSADVLPHGVNCKEFNSDPDSHDLVWLADKVWDRFRGLFNDAFVGAATAAHQPSKYPPGQTTHGLRRDTEPRKGGCLWIAQLRQHQSPYLCLRCLHRMAGVKRRAPTSYGPLRHWHEARSQTRCSPCCPC